MKNTFKTSAAFSLVELMVAVTITGFLFLGVSVFFSQHLSQLNNLSHQSDLSRDHFILQETLRKKLMQAQSLISLKGNQLILENDSEATAPFSLLGMQDDKVVLKDFFPMQGIANHKIVSEFESVHGATGMTYLAPYYYLSAFGENAIYLCDENKNCNIFAENVTKPLGLSHSETHLFVAQSDGVILKINKQNSNDRTVLSDDFEKPIGVAYYQNGQGYEFLFVADSKANLVKRIDLQNNTVQVSVGLGKNFSCDSSALFCELKSPTGLSVDGNSLYIADTGHGRIIKVSEPEVTVNNPMDLKLEFEIDPQIFLEYFSLTGNFEGETLDTTHSNIVGSANNYNAETKRFTNSIVEPAPIDGCKMSQNMFSTLALESNGFEVNDYIGIDGSVYKITAFKGQKNCQTNPQGNAIYRYETNVNPKPNGKDSFFAYGANYAAPPTMGKVILAFNNAIFNQSGFQTIKVETQDFMQEAVVETDEILIRVGNGTLGSSEDVAEVWAENLNYPNALSADSQELWVSDAKENKVIKFNMTDKNKVEEPLVTPGISNFSPFDFTSKFPVKNFNISQVEGGNLLEISFEADVAEGKSKTYLLNKALPKL